MNKSKLFNHFLDDRALGSKWQWLQLLCLEEEIPNEVNPNYGVGGYRIPDIAWMEARLWAPALKVQYVFSNEHILQYNIFFLL